MKSSTIRRSNLSKEKMAVLEALSNYRQDSYDNSPNVYIRPEMPQDKDSELDMLWRNFKVGQKSEKSPNVYLMAGFVAGSVVMLLLAVLISFSVKGISNVKENIVVPAKKEKMALDFVPSSSENSSAKSEIYTVKSGDTIESIVIRYYGSYSKEKEDLIVRTNNMENPDKLAIDQQLTIPLGF